jgi:hypothetical protein
MAACPFNKLATFNEQVLASLKRKRLSPSFGGNSSFRGEI